MKVIILCGFVLLSGFSSVSAQYTGPSSQTAYATVAEINAKPVDDVKVSFQGFLIKKIGNEKYIFSDGTGEIRVEIDNEIFPSVPIDAKTKVEIRGEIEKDFLESPEIDVDVVRIVE